jgi:ribosomal protein S18 acetylase RimI-like enzyme
LGRLYYVAYSPAVTESEAAAIEDIHLTSLAQSPTRFGLNVLPDNVPAVQLYEALGFQAG